MRHEEGGSRSRRGGKYGGRERGRISVRERGYSRKRK